MAESLTDELGPVDYLVIEFPAESALFSHEMAMELATLVESELIQMLDLILVRKNEDGSVEALELDEMDEMIELRKVETQIAEILATEDIAHIAEAIEPGTTAGVLVWENTWVTPFASATRRAGGRLVAGGRMPIQSIIASLEAESAN